MNEQLVKMGILTKLYGFKGELVFKLDSFNAAIIDNFKWVFISLHDEQVPFKVLNHRIVDSANVILQLSGINDELNAKNLVGNKVFISADAIKIPSAAISIDHKSILGWHVFFNAENLGPITDIIENKTQILLEINYYNQSKFIPFVSEFILSVDKKNRSILMDLPEGLLDL